MTVKFDKKNTSALEVCLVMVKERIADMPTHELFQYLQKQLVFIDTNLDETRKLPADVFDRLNIGVICAKELEGIDDEFCNAIYEMLEEVGPKIVWCFETN